MPLREGLVLTDASEQDLPSLATLFSRAFHPNNEYHRQSCPDTPATREWWRESHKRGIEDPASRVLIVRDSQDNGNAIAFLRAKRFEPDEPSVGMWSQPLSQDHNEAMFTALIDVMLEYKTKLMAGRPHYMIELFGTDGNYQKSGAGTALLKRCCEIADAEGVDIFVEANGGAAGFYERHGFESKAETVMPGGLNYRELMMVRQKKT